MKCKKAKFLCSELLDGRLSGRKREALLLHLSTCPHCMSFYKQVKKIKELTSSLPTPELSPNFNEAVMYRIERSKAGLRPRTIFLFKRRFALFLLPLVLIALALISVFHNKPDENELLRSYRKEHFIYTLQNPLISADSAVKMLLISGQE
ncbi:zf-HC2 domain-containing protein [bacterium]|nr:zf-HC2 domain-containing protein [bacterium]